MIRGANVKIFAMPSAKPRIIDSTPSLRLEPLVSVFQFLRGSHHTTSPRSADELVGVLRRQTDGRTDR